MDKEGCDGDCGNCGGHSHEPSDGGEHPEEQQWIALRTDEVKDLMSRNGFPSRMHSPICNSWLKEHKNCTGCVSFQACKALGIAHNLLHRIGAIMVLGNDPEEIIKEKLERMMEKQFMASLPSPEEMKKLVDKLKFKRVSGKNDPERAHLCKACSEQCDCGNKAKCGGCSICWDAGQMKPWM